MIFFNRRIIGTTLCISVLVTLFLFVTRIPLIPCLRFVADSSRGYYPGICALIDKHGDFLLSQARGYYSPITSIWTWTGLIIITLIIPYIFIILLNEKTSKKTNSKH